MRGGLEPLQARRQQGAPREAFRHRGFGGQRGSSMRLRCVPSARSGERPAPAYGDTPYWPPVPLSDPVRLEIVSLELPEAAYGRYARGSPLGLVIGELLRAFSAGFVLIFLSSATSQRYVFGKMYSNNVYCTVDIKAGHGSDPHPCIGSQDFCCIS